MLNYLWKSQRITPTAINPGKPELPSSETRAVMLPTTPPKKAMLPAPTSKVRTIAKARSARPKSVRNCIKNLMILISSNIKYFKNYFQNFDKKNPIIQNYWVS